MKRRTALTAVAASVVFPTDILRASTKKKQPDYPKDVSRLVNIVNVGSDNNPATSAQIELVQKMILRHEPKDIMGKQMFLVTEKLIDHVRKSTGLEIAVRSFAHTQGTTMTVVLGSENRPATQLDLEDVQENLTRTAKDNNLTIVTHHNFHVVLEKTHSRVRRMRAISATPTPNHLLRVHFSPETEKKMLQAAENLRNRLDKIRSLG